MEKIPVEHSTVFPVSLTHTAKGNGFTPGCVSGKWLQHVDGAVCAPNWPRGN